MYAMVVYLDEEHLDGDDSMGNAVEIVNEMFRVACASVEWAGPVPQAQPLSILVDC